MAREGVDQARCGFTAIASTVRDEERMIEAGRFRMSAVLEIDDWSQRTDCLGQ
jgi:hypothetical protein